jgi:hypothetical protein
MPNGSVCINYFTVRRRERDLQDRDSVANVARLVHYSLGMDITSPAAISQSNSFQL